KVFAKADASALAKLVVRQAAKAAMEPVCMSASLNAKHAGSQLVSVRPDGSRNEEGTNMAMENTMRFLHENVFHDPEDYTRGGVVDTSDKTVYIDDKVLEVTKRQKISRLLLFTETGEGSCPLACSYCFLAKAGVNKKMSEKTLRDAIDWLRAVS